MQMKNIQHLIYTHTHRSCAMYWFWTHNRFRSSFSILLFATLISSNILRDITFTISLLFLPLFSFVWDFICFSSIPSSCSRTQNRVVSSIQARYNTLNIRLVWYILSLTTEKAIQVFVEAFVVLYSQRVFASPIFFVFDCYGKCNKIE